MLSHSIENYLLHRVNLLIYTINEGTFIHFIVRNLINREHKVSDTMIYIGEI